MPYKKKAIPGTGQLKRKISELPKNARRLKDKTEFRNDVLESQKRVHYKNESGRLQGAKKTAWIRCQNKIKTERATEAGKTIIKRRPIASYLFF